MIEGDATIGAAFPRLIVAGRRVAAIVVGGVLAALAWMFVLQEGHTGNIFGATWTDHDFADGLGHAVGAKDTAKAGLYLTLALGVLFAGLYAGVERWLPGRGIVKGLVFSPIPFLAWGLVFAPLVDSRQVLREARLRVSSRPAPLASRRGSATIISGVAASIIAGVIIARVAALARDAAWWQEHPNVGLGLGGDDPSGLLELAEERPEQGVEGPR